MMIFVIKDVTKIIKKKLVQWLYLININNVLHIHINLVISYNPS